MKRVLLALALLGFGAGMAYADPTDLDDGVFIVHHDPTMTFSPPPAGWCAIYPQYAITSCDQQHPCLTGGAAPEDLRAWFVLAQWWDEAKTWCATEFGFGAYDPNLYVMMDYGPCVPSGFLEIPSANWPGPNEGTIVTTTDVPWSGNFVPTYYFAGYEYVSPGQIPISVDPATDFAGFINCLTPAVAYDAECLPAMGVGMDGVYCCSQEPVEPFPCCIGEDCVMLMPADCAAQGGVIHTEYPDCDPNPCVIRACCDGPDCYLLNVIECEAIMGEFLIDERLCEPNPCELPAWACCTDCQICTILTEAECRDIQGAWLEGVECEPNPCDPSPAENTSWGNIKAIYR